jgi:hypothetical protein
VFRVRAPQSAFGQIGEISTGREIFLASSLADHGAGRGLPSGFFNGCLEFPRSHFHGQIIVPVQEEEEEAKRKRRGSEEEEAEANAEAKQKQKRSKSRTKSNQKHEQYPQTTPNIKHQQQSFLLTPVLPLHWV